MWTYRCPPSATPAATVMQGKTPLPDRPSPPRPDRLPAVTAPQKEQTQQTQGSVLSQREPVRPVSTSRHGIRKGVFLTAALYLAGLAGGTITLKVLPRLEPFFTLYSRNLAQVQTGIGPDMLFSMGFLGHIGMLLALFFSGLCVFGSPLIGTAFLLRGMWESAYLTSFYVQYGWKGVALYTVVFWLPGLIFLGFQLQFGADALIVSRLLRQNCLHADGAPGLLYSVRRFRLRFLTFGALGVVAAILQVAFFLMFGVSLT